MNLENTTGGLAVSVHNSDSQKNIFGGLVVSVHNSDSQKNIFGGLVVSIHNSDSQKNIFYHQFYLFFPIRKRKFQFLTIFDILLKKYDWGIRNHWTV